MLKTNPPSPYGYSLQRETELHDLSVAYSVWVLQQKVDCMKKKKPSSEDGGLGRCGRDVY
jgi:hypothetical protein